MSGEFELRRFDCRREWLDREQKIKDRGPPLGRGLEFPVTLEKKW